jgi:hypothetical protein
VEELAQITVGESTVALRRASSADVPALVALIAADQLGAARDGVRDSARGGGLRTGAHRFYQRLGFAALHEGMKLAL